MRRSQAGRKKVSQFGQYYGYSEAIYDGYQRSSQYLTLEDGTWLAYDLLLPTKDGMLADKPLPTLFKYTPYLRAFTIYDADGNLLLDDLYELKWYERAALRMRYMLSDQGHLMDTVANIGQRFGAVLGAYGQLKAKHFDVALVLYPISGHRQAGIPTTAQYQCSASLSRLPSSAKSSWRRNKVTEAISHATEDHLPYQ